MSENGLDRVAAMETQLAEITKTLNTLTQALPQLTNAGAQSRPNQNCMHVSLAEPFNYKNIAK